MDPPALSGVEIALGIDAHSVTADIDLKERLSRATPNLTPPRPTTVAKPLNGTTATTMGDLLHGVADNPWQPMRSIHWLGVYWSIPWKNCYGLTIAIPQIIDETHR